MRNKEMPAFLINLARDKVRLASMDSQLRDQGIAYERFERATI